MTKDEPMCVEVDGVQVFSSRFVFEQMQAQNYRIDRIYTIEKVSCLLSVITFCLSTFTLLKVLL